MAKIFFLLIKTIDNINIKLYNINQKGGSIMPMKPKEMVKLLKKNGFIQIPNNNGSHQTYMNPKTGCKVTVAMHSKEMKKGTEQAILKQTGLK